MSKPLVTDELWGMVEPLLPKHDPSPKGGRPRVSDRVCFTGILFVLKSGIPWEDFPCEMGCCGMTLWKRLEEWTKAGVWEELHAVLLDHLRKHNALDLGKVVVDSTSVRAMHGGKKRGPSPVDRRKPGTKHHLVVDAKGTPLAATVTAANRHDVTQLLPLIDAIQPIRGTVGAPRFKPQEAYADRAYDSEPLRDALRDRQIKPFLAKRNTLHGSGLGVVRWFVEQSEALLHQFRRLKMRFDKRDDIHEAFVNLAQIVICWRRLGRVMGFI